MRMRFQFSLAGLMGSITFFALSLAALRYASDLWVGVVFTLTLVSLLGSLLGCMISPASKRFVWAAFALVGWSYMLVAFGPWFNVNVRPRLITTHLADYLQPKVQERIYYMKDADQAKQMRQFFWGGQKGALEPPWGRFERIAHCVFALALAFAAAKLSSWWSATPSRDAANAAPPVQEFETGGNA